jgi:hypothetical protein
MSTLICQNHNGDLEDVEFDFANVTFLLPNRRSALSGEAAVCIALGDTDISEIRAGKKVGGPFLNLCGGILGHIDLCARSDRTSGSSTWLSSFVQYQWQESG